MDYLQEAKSFLANAEDVDEEDAAQTLATMAHAAATIALAECLQGIESILEKIADENRRGRFQRKSWWE